jgi:GTPase
MIATVALVGRPNVGKSTLFNRLTKSRSALVHDQPGLTRDRHYGRARAGDREFLVIDTGGFEPVATSGIEVEMARQAESAIAEADVVVFIVDGREGLTAQDTAIAERLRRTGRSVLLAVNKAEGMSRERVTAEFHELAMGEPLPISAAHGENVREFVDLILADLPPDAAPEDADAEHPVRVAIVGRPNVGKSTLVNTLLGEERVIAFDEPGTTRDSIHLDFERDGKHYTLIDTAGVRKRGKVTETIEKFSVLKTLQSIEDANVVILLLDATADVSEQDAHIASYILEAGRALVVGVNKWDGADADRRESIKRDIARKLAFLDFADQHYISAKEGKGMKAMMAAVDRAYNAAMARLPTPRLTRALIEAVQRQQPARTGMTRPKMRYAHQGGHNPPLVIIHGTSLNAIPDAYRRYLEHFFTATFKLRGTPLRIQFKTGANPYADSAVRRQDRSSSSRPGRRKS